MLSKALWILIKVQLPCLPDFVIPRTLRGLNLDLPIISIVFGLHVSGPTSSFGYRTCEAPARVTSLTNALLAQKLPSKLMSYQ